ncbi:hypothetical protein [Fulvimarina sp. MAC3]|uniref:hypothetical protein n=1 Tax=Fulvimarina sp. MAC3 TaxID=3148887 RepID=UPI0031FDFF6C
MPAPPANFAEASSPAIRELTRSARFPAPFCAGDTSPYVGGWKSCKIADDQSISLQVGSQQKHASAIAAVKDPADHHMPDYLFLTANLNESLQLGYSLWQNDSDLGRESAKWDALKSGSFSAYYRPPASALTEALDTRTDGLSPCKFGASYAPRFFDLKRLGTARNKALFKMKCDWKPTERLTLSASVNVYPFPEQQQPWNSDFEYKIEYKVTDELKVGFTDFSGNRFPWKRTKDETPIWYGGKLWASFKRTF